MNYPYPNPGQQQFNPQPGPQGAPGAPQGAPGYPPQGYVPQGPPQGPPGHLPAPQGPQGYPQGAPAGPPPPQGPPQGAPGPYGGPGYPQQPMQGGYPQQNPGAPGGYPPPQAQPGGYPQGQPHQRELNPQQKQALFGAIAGAEAGGTRHPKIPSGNFHLRLEKCEFFTGRTGDEFFTAEFTVLSSDQPTMPAGLYVAYLQKLSGTSRDVGAAAVKRFLAALMGFDPSNKQQVEALTPEEVDKMAGPQQPYRGRELFCVGTDAQTKKQVWVVNYQWQLYGHAPEQPQQQQYQQPPQQQYQQPPQQQYQQPPQQQYQPPAGNFAPPGPQNGGWQG